MSLSTFLRPTLLTALCAIGMTTSLPGAALTLGEYRSGRTDPANRESQDAYLYVTFQGMVWYGTALHDTHPDAPPLFCVKMEELPGEQAVADMILAETTDLKGDEATTTPMEMVLINGLEKRFPCK